MNSGARTLRFEQKVLNGSVNQLDRVRGAPRPDPVRVDGRTVAQLLAFAARYGALVRFYDLDDLPHGDWSEFFAADPAVAAALHGALDFPEIEDQLRKLLGEARTARTHQDRAPALRRLMGGIVRLIGILDRHWPGEGEAERQLQHLARSRRRDAITVHLESLHLHWSSTGCQVWAVVDIEVYGPHWIEGLLTRLEALFTSLIESLRLGAEAALQASAASLEVRGHAPQAALYNAFVMLFIEARQELNRFPSRLLNFYYADILGQHLRPAEPDQVYLTFTLGKNVEDTSIPRGTLFLAGTDAHGDPIQYAADSSLEVTPVAVSSMSVHRLTYLEGAPAVATGVLSGVVAQGEPGGGLPAPFPLFGRDLAGTYGALTLQPASLGFIVASPLLMLTGGSRTVQINLTHSDPDETSTASAAHTGASLASLATPAFALYYTTAGGWVAVEAFTVTPGSPSTTSGAPTITFAFTLPPDAPPMVALSTQPGPNDPAPDLAASAFPCAADCPSLVATLMQAPGLADGDTPGSELHFAILSLIEVAQITLDVSVDGLVPAALSGSSGPLDPSQNFAIFGLQPTQYTTLTISSPELFVKPITGLQAAIGWAGLPVASTGFQGYYQGYRLNADGQLSSQPLFDNTSFKATFGIVSPGSWTLDASASFYLFQTAGSSTGSSGPPPAAGAPVLMTSALVAAGVAPAAVPAYYNPDASALSLTLAEPSYAFGNVLYASNLMAASSTSVSALRARAVGDSADRSHGAATQIASAASVNAAATDKNYARDLGAAVSQAMSALNGKVLGLLQQAAAGAPASASTQGDGDTQAAWLRDLEAALRGVSSPVPGGLWGRLLQLAHGVLEAFAKEPDAGAVTTRLRSWLAAHQDELGANASDLLQQAQALLAASDNLGATLAGAARQPPAVARPTMSAALQQARAVVDQTDARSAQATAATLASVLPNPPWLPMVSSFTLSYTASAAVVLQTLASDAPVKSEGAEDATGAPDDAELSSAAETPGFLHLCPFDQMALAQRGLGRRVTLLPRVARHSALYIDLSAPAEQVSLLFILQAGPDGWSSEEPVVLWEQRVGDAWLRVKVMGDSTNGLLNSGIVTLALRARSRISPEMPPQLRVRLVKGLDHSPLVSAVIANALTATWVPPGGAQQRGQPLPAGTITQMTEPITGIASISQPMNSIGGSPPAVGPSFDLWMAERLRHKGFAIDAWDYARIVLAAVPTLWQLGVVPAIDESTGRAAPGHVWIVAVAGPNTPNVDDPTMPSVDPAVLAEIGELLERVTSPFVTLTVSNPPWLPLRVDADLVFSDTDTVDASEARLQDELVRWLSPWPDPALGPRPADYFSREAVATFVRERDYVLGITSLHLHPVAEAGPVSEGWHYLTSAKKHRLHGVAARGADPQPSRNTRALARQA